MNKQRVFISYSSADNVWVRAFANSLQQRGIEVFDYNAIDPGQSWKERIEKGLRQSSVIVLLVTPETIKRPNLYLEIGAAIGMGKPLIMVASKEVDPSTLPATLRGSSYLLKGSPDLTAKEFVAKAEEYNASTHI